jgi:hypothetical protein
VLPSLADEGKFDPVIVKTLLPTGFKKLLKGSGDNVNGEEKGIFLAGTNGLIGIKPLASLNSGYH